MMMRCLMRVSRCWAQSSSSSWTQCSSRSSWQQCLTRVSIKCWGQCLARVNICWGQWRPFCAQAPPKTPEIPHFLTRFTYFCLFSEVTVAVVDPFGEKHEFFMRLRILDDWCRSEKWCLYSCMWSQEMTRSPKLRRCGKWVSFVANKFGPNYSTNESWPKKFEMKVRSIFTFLRWFCTSSS